jgi:capsular exopolysaccharide synthesis family protein
VCLPSVSSRSLRSQSTRRRETGREKETKIRRYHDNGDVSDGLVALFDPSNLASEAYRILRTNLFYAAVDSPPKVIVLTAPGSGEGKTNVCANLGVVLAQANKKVLILDCDWRKPTMHKVFELRNISGIVNVLAGERRLEEVWQEPLSGLKMISAGPPPPDPTGLLESRSFAEVLDQVRREFDYVLIDTPPVKTFSDPLILSRRADGVLLVLDAQHTRKQAVRQAIHKLRNVDANIIGTIMNRAQSPRVDYQYDYA